MKFIYKDICKNCGKLFIVRRYRERISLCRKCMQQKSARESHKRIRIKALNFYGGKCQSCGNEDTRVLQFHHTIRIIDKHGNREVDHVRRIAREGKDSLIELLCANCHILANLRDGTNTHIE